MGGEPLTSKCKYVDVNIHVHVTVNVNINVDVKIDVKVDDNVGVYGIRS